ncbi:unnamed protein product [Lathyrus sativus]|nr:unnamed protein product [Lathyrus sativus]
MSSSSIPSLISSSLLRKTTPITKPLYTTNSNSRKPLPIINTITMSSLSSNNDNNTPDYPGKAPPEIPIIPKTEPPSVPKENPTIPTREPEIDLDVPPEIVTNPPEFIPFPNPKPKPEGPKPPLSPPGQDTPFPIPDVVPPQPPDVVPPRPPGPDIVPPPCIPPPPTGPTMI